MKKIFSVLLFAAAMLSSHANAQSLEEAVEFIYCGDKGWSDCPYTGELEECSITLESVTNLKFRIHFNNFIWNSMTTNLFTNSLSLSCDGDCIEDLNGNLEDYFVFNLGRFFDSSSYTLGFNAAPSRVMRAVDVVEKSCPGKQSSF